MAFRQIDRVLIACACTVAAALTGLTAMQGPAQAATSSGTFSVRGLGAQSCKDVTATAQGKQADELFETSSSWIAGYVSQFNRSNANTYEAVPVVDNNMLGRLAVNLCRSNPDALFEAIAASLIQSFAGGGLSSESPVIEIKYGENAAIMRRAVFGMAQQELIKLGFLPAGAADGDYGPRSREALSRYQEARGIKITGVPDLETLVHLFAMGEPTKDGSRKQRASAAATQTQGQE